MLGRWTTAAATAAITWMLGITLPSTMVDSLPIIMVRGNGLYNSETGDRFLIRGITYEYDVSNDNYEANSKAAILRAHKDFNGTLNSLRVYHINPEKNYSKFMNHMNELGIYVMIAASPGGGDYFGSYQWSPLAKASGPDDVPTCYPPYLLNYGKSIAKLFSAYNNTLGMVMGNEVMQKSLIAASCIKQYVADLKNWMRSKQDKMRLLPLAYASADGAYIGEKNSPKPPSLIDADEYAVVKIQGLLCGDKMVNGVMQESIDIYMINEYRWCVGSTFQTSYKRLQTMAQGLPIVIALGEYGCDKNPPRTFEMVQYLFGDSKTSSGFSDLFSGGYVYSFGEADLGKNTGFPLFTGGDVSILGKPGTVATPDYANLVAQFKKYPPTQLGKATWETTNATAKCAWVPPVATTTDKSNKRATELGWFVKECSVIKIAPNDTWITASRENAVCNPDGGACDVLVKKNENAVTQVTMCGAQVEKSSDGGKNCAKDTDCGNGSCDKGQCKCKTCFTGPQCLIAVADETICKTPPPASSNSNSPSKPGGNGAASISVGIATVVLTIISSMA